MKTLRKMGLKEKLLNLIKLIYKKDPPANILDSGRRALSSSNWKYCKDASGLSVMPYYRFVRYYHWEKLEKGTKNLSLLFPPAVCNYDYFKIKMLLKKSEKTVNFFQLGHPGECCSGGLLMLSSNILECWAEMWDPPQPSIRCQRNALRLSEARPCLLFTPIFRWTLTSLGKESLNFMFSVFLCAFISGFALEGSLTSEYIEFLEVTLYPDHLNVPGFSVGPARHAVKSSLTFTCCACRLHWGVSSIWGPCFDSDFSVSQFGNPFALSPLLVAQLPKWCGFAAGSSLPPPAAPLETPTHSLCLHL